MLLQARSAPVQAINRVSALVPRDDAVASDLCHVSQVGSDGPSNARTETPMEHVSRPCPDLGTIEVKGCERSASSGFL